jgi:hypothetical protein
VAPGDRAAAEAVASLTWVGTVRAGAPEAVLLSAGVAQTVRGFQHRL